MLQRRIQDFCGGMREKIKKTIKICLYGLLFTSFTKLSGRVFKPCTPPPPMDTVLAVLTLKFCSDILKVSVSVINVLPNALEDIKIALFKAMAHQSVLPFLRNIVDSIPITFVLK